MAAALIVGIATAASVTMSAAPALAHPSPPHHSAGVSAWVTDLATGQHLSPEKVGAWRHGRTPANTITVDPSRRYQSMVGFGGSLTDSAAYDLATGLDAAARTKVMTELFSRRDGIGLSMLRQPMGASDLSAHGSYSYDDLPAGETDPTLKHFSIDHDRQQIIPLLKEAKKLDPQLALMATPWSPPGWMKTSDSMIGGILKPEYYTAYADYFAKFVAAYRAEGLPIDYVSAQNEPLYSPATYPGMSFPATDEAEFIAKDLGPTLARTSPQTKILGYDHNWDDTDYPETMFTTAASRYVPATAWHCYGGSVTAQTVSHNDFPSRGAFMTECSGGTWQGTDQQAFAATMGLVIGAPRNWARSITLWNLALNDQNGPTNGGCDTCRGLVTVHADGTVSRNLDYWGLGQLSKFVTPGATRVASSRGPVSNVAFVNPDGSRVVVAYNGTGAAQRFSIAEGSAHVTTTLAAGAAATYRWRGTVPGSSRRGHGAPGADLGQVDLHVGQGLVQTVGADEVAAMNQVKVGDSWVGYSLPHGATLAPTGTSTTLDRSGWTATASSSAEGDVPSNMLDGDETTRWSSGAAQAPGQWISLDLGAERTFDGIVLDEATSPTDYPRGYEVETSSDGSSWQPIARGTGTEGTTTIVLPPTTTRYLRIVQEGTSGSWWSIHELNLTKSSGTTASGSTSSVSLPHVRRGSDRGRLTDGTRLLGIAAGRHGSTLPLTLGGAHYRYTMPADAAVTFAQIPASVAASSGRSN